EHVAMLEENSRIIAAHRSAQQSYRIFGIGGITNLPADGMRPQHLPADGVPGIAALRKSARHAHDNRSGKAIRSAPANRSAVIDLLLGRIRVFTELNLRHRHEP